MRLALIQAGLCCYSTLANAGWLANRARRYRCTNLLACLYIRALAQDGSQGEPLHSPPWDLKRRVYNLNPRNYEQGGGYASVPTGYWVDVSALAAAYKLGTPARPAKLAHILCRYAFYRVRPHQRTSNWYSAMLELYPVEIFVTPTRVLAPSITPSKTLVPTRNTRPHAYGADQVPHRPSPSHRPIRLHHCRLQPPSLAPAAHLHHRRSFHEKNGTCMSLRAYFPEGHRDDVSKQPPTKREHVIASELCEAISCRERIASQPKSGGSHSVPIGNDILLILLLLIILSLTACTDFVSFPAATPVVAVTSFEVQNETPTPTLEPFRFTLPTPGAEPISGWRSPYIPCRGPCLRI